MKAIASLLFFFIIGNTYAQVFDVETIFNSGADDKRINLVILSDGYQQSELDQFIVDANSFTNELFTQTPFLEYKDYFNVYAIKVPSAESGASHPGTATDVNEPVHPIISVDNYFGSTFDYASIHRLLVPINSSAINNVLADNFPLYDQVLILVNSPYYGGSGGQYATTSLESSANEIAIHELGHSFSSLRDEYWAGNQYAQEDINMTQETDPSLVRWTNWHGDNGIGIYQHCCGGNSALWYRPHENCKMRFLGVPFCSVCIEGTIERIHSLVTPIEGFTPTTTTFSTNSFPLDFSLQIVAPTPNTLDINWIINGTNFSSGTSSISLESTDLLVGGNTVFATVEDVSSYLRVDNHSSVHLSTVLWNVEYDPTLGITTFTQGNKNVSIDIYPNPSEDIINLKFDAEGMTDFKVEMYSLDGKLVKTSLPTISELISMDISNLADGVFLLKIYSGNNFITAKQIVKK